MVSYIVGGYVQFGFRVLLMLWYIDKTMSLGIIFFPLQVWYCRYFETIGTQLKSSSCGIHF